MIGAQYQEKSSAESGLPSPPHEPTAPVNAKHNIEKVSAVEPEKLRQRSQSDTAESTHDTATEALMTAAERQTPSTPLEAENHNPEQQQTVPTPSKKLTTLQKLFSPVSVRESIVIPQLADIDPFAKHLVQQSTAVVEDISQSQSTPRRSSNILVPHYEDGYEMTIVLPVSEAWRDPSINDVQPSPSFMQVSDAAAESMKLCSANIFDIVGLLVSRGLE